MMKKFISILLCISLVLGIGVVAFADEKIESKDRSEKDIKFIAKHYNVTEEYAKGLPDVTFNALKKEKPSGCTSDTRYFVLTEKKENKVLSDQLPENEFYNNIDENIIAKEVTVEEFENARNKNGNVINAGDVSTIALLDSDITKDYGWVELTTKIYYFASSDNFFILNQTEYLQGSYFTLSPYIDFVSGIGTNSNMSIVNTSPYFKYEYTIINQQTGSVTDWTDSGYTADFTRDDGYGFILSIAQNPYIGHTNMRVYTSVLAEPNVSNLILADAYGHFSRTQASIDMQSSLGVFGSNLSIEPVSKTTKVGPIHVQVER